MLAAWDILKPLLSQTIAARNLHGTVLPQQLKTATMQDLSCCPMCKYATCDLVRGGRRNPCPMEAATPEIE